MITGCGGTYCIGPCLVLSGLIRCLARASRPLRLAYRGSVGALCVSAYVSAPAPVGVRVLKLRLGHLSLVATPVRHFGCFRSLLWSGPFVYMLPFFLDVYTVRYSRGDDNHAKGGG